MQTRTGAVAGVVLLLVALVCAGAVAFRPAPLSRSPLTRQLLGLRNLDVELSLTALQLRLGLQTNYDRLTEVQDRLDAEALVVATEVLHMPAASSVHAKWREYLATVEPRRERLEAFPTENATLNNSLRVLERACDRARQRLELEPVTGILGADLDELLHTALSANAFGDFSDLRRSAAEARRRVPRANGPKGGPLETYLDHVEIVVEQGEHVAELARWLSFDAGWPLLDELVQAVGDEQRRAGIAADRERRFAYGASLLAAVAACSAVVAGIRSQSRALRKQMEESRQAHEEARRYEQQLRQAQKLEAVGQLAAGIAHEINTPTQFVTDNVQFLRESLNELTEIVRECVELARQPGAPAEATQRLAAVAARAEALQLESLLEEIPGALADSIEGLDRITQIVRAMKSFSHPAGTQELVDLNESLTSTVTVARSEWKYVAELHLDLSHDLARIPGWRGELNQVFLNLIVNAAQAIAESRNARPGEKGRIAISSRASGDDVELRFEDDGTGMPDAVRERVFDPFFTTKPVGRGSGQGLAIAHGVIVDLHGGSIRVESEVGRGSTFVVRLPLKGTAPRADAA